MRLRIEEEAGDTIADFVAIIESIRHDFYPSHAKYRKAVMDDLKKGMDIFLHAPGGWSAAMYTQQKWAYRLAKGTRAKGPGWYAVAKCDNCGGKQLTDSSVAQAKRWLCVTCFKVCDIGWVEEKGRLKAIESINKAFDAYAMKEGESFSAWELKAIKLHRRAVAKGGCKVRAQTKECTWCN